MKKSWMTLDYCVLYCKVKPLNHFQTPNFMDFNGLYWMLYWSGKRGSNSRPQPWQGCALPTELFPQKKCFKWCPGRDLNSHGQKGRGILNPLCLPISPPGLKT